MADRLHREGSLYAYVPQSDVFVIAWTMRLVTVGRASLVCRDRKGLGFQGIAIISLYVLALVTVVPT